MCTGHDMWTDLQAIPGQNATDLVSDVCVCVCFVCLYVSTKFSAHQCVSK